MSASVAIRRPSIARARQPQGASRRRRTGPATSQAKNRCRRPAQPPDNGNAAIASLRQRRCSSSLRSGARTRRRRAYAADAKGPGKWRSVGRPQRERDRGPSRLALGQGKQAPRPAFTTSGKAAAKTRNAAGGLSRAAPVAPLRRFPRRSSVLRIVAKMLRVARPSIPPQAIERNPPGLPELRADRELGPDYESRISRGRRGSGRLLLGRRWC